LTPFSLNEFLESNCRISAGLDGIRDRAIFLIACFCALRPSELFA